MISVYIYINLFLAAAWGLFQLLPMRGLSYRGRKGLAQSVLVSSLLAIPIFAALPDVSFPSFSAPVDVMKGRDVDSVDVPRSPVQLALQQASSVAKMAPARINLLP